MLRVLTLLLAAFSAFGADYTCTSTGAGNLSDSSKWSSCNSTYPHNNGADRYVVVANHAIVQDVASLTLGFNGAQIYGYVDLVTNNEGSGYVGCSVGQISGGTQVSGSVGFPATAYTRVVNGKCIVYLYDRGFYSAGTPTLGAISQTSGTITAASTVKGNPTTLVISNATPSIWRIGSTQSITISGATGTGWTGLNATWTATVTGISGNGLSITVPLDSSGFTGTPGGTIVTAAGTAASYTLNYVAGGGTAAMRVGTGGKITFSGGTTTTLLGSMQWNDQNGNSSDAYVWDGTSGDVVVTLDSSGASGTPMYELTDNNNFFTYRTLRTTGCTSVSGHTCTLQGVNPIRISAPSDFVPTTAIDGMIFSKVGDKYTPALTTWSSTTTTSIVNSIFDTCGRINIVTRVDGSISLNHNLWRNTPLVVPGYGAEFPPVNVEIVATNAPNGGVTRTIQFSHLDGQLGPWINGQQAALRSFDFFGSFFGRGINSGVNQAWSQFASSVVRFTPPDSSSPQATALPAAWTDSYIWFDADKLYNYKAVGSMGNNSKSITRNVHGFSGTSAGDSGEWYNHNNTDVVTETFGSNVFLCGADGIGGAEIASPTGSGPFWVLNHNTFCGGYGQFAPIDVNEGGSFPQGHLTFTNNLVWVSPSGSASLKIYTLGSPGTTDVCSPVSNCDYNAGYGTAATQSPCTGCTNQGRGYGGAWSSTPGVHDVDGVNPNFVGSTRKLENFDTGYLGYATATAWDGGSTYAYGDYVSNSDAAVYGGETFNYRCINTSGCTGLGAPGVNGTAWRDNWEFGSISRIAAASYAQTQYYDCGLGLNGAYVAQTLVAWIIAGYRPQAAQYIGAASDGGNIGVPAPAPCTTPPSISRTVSISTGTIK